MKTILSLLNYGVHDMSLQELATKLANKKIRIIDTKYVPNYDRDPNPIGRVIGYRKSKSNVEQIVIEPDNPYDCPTRGSLRPTSIKWVVDNVPSATHLWYVRTTNFEVIDDASAKKPVIASYPHKCPKCGSPALWMSSAIDCSNSQCSHKYVSKSALDLFIKVK